MRSAFGIEHPLAKAVRLDRALEVVLKPRKGRLTPVATPLADAKLGPRIVKSAFGIVHKGPAVAADVALAPNKVKAVTATVRPGAVVPARGASPRRPMTQKLDDAVTATGGSPT